MGRILREDNLLCIRKRKFQVMKFERARPISQSGAAAGSYQVEFPTATSRAAFDTPVAADGVKKTFSTLRKTRPATRLESMTSGPSLPREACKNFAVDFFRDYICLVFNNLTF